MSEDDPIRIMVVDDTDVIRQSFELVIQAFDGLEMVAEAASGQQAITLCAENQPDVMLLDMIMPGMKGDEVTRRVLESWPDIRIIAISSIGGEDLLAAALEAGAVMALPKDTTPTELADAIRSVMSSS